MITRDGQVFTESNYDGYGIFGGKDFYELLAEINPGIRKTSDAGIDLSSKDNPSGDYNGKFEMPKLVQHISITRKIYPDMPNEEYTEKFQKWFDSLDYPETCEHQGYFYPSDEDEEFNDSYDDDDEY
jgi:hypothetical protein